MLLTAANVFMTKSSRIRLRRMRDLVRSGIIIFIEHPKFLFTLIDNEFPLLLRLRRMRDLVGSEIIIFIRVLQIFVYHNRIRVPCSPALLRCAPTLKLRRKRKRLREGAAVRPLLAVARRDDLFQYKV
jgi:hypothetical protein